jgi:hypothetical protein
VIIGASASRSDGVSFASASVSFTARVSSSVPRSAMI